MMQVVHVTQTDERVLASDATVANSLHQKIIGVMFKAEFPDSDGIVFPFTSTRKYGIHTLFVRFPIDVIWVVDNHVTEVKQLRSWVGFGRAEADCVIEVPAGNAARVSVGDTIEFRDNNENR